MQGLKYMSKEEGIRGMFRGNWTNCVRIIPNSAVKFLTYEQLSRCIACTLLHMHSHAHRFTHQPGLLYLNNASAHCL